MVSHLWCEESRSWTLRSRRNLTDEEVEEWSTLLQVLSPLRPSTRQDYRVWSLSSGGSFTVKSLMDKLTEQCSVLPDEFIPCLWSSKVPKKVKVFIWILVQEKLNTCNTLQAKRPNLASSPSSCLLCKGEMESHACIFFFCEFTATVWSLALRVWVELVLSSCKEAFFQLFFGSPKKEVLVI